MYITLLLLHNYYEECVALVLNLPNMVSLFKNALISILHGTPTFTVKPLLSGQCGTQKCS